MLNWIRILRRPAAIAIGLFIIYMSLRSSLNLTQYMSDKVMHFMAYGTWAAAACTTPRSGRWLAFYAAIIFATGLAIEFIQPGFGRDKSMLDMLANTLGLAVGILGALWARRRLFGTGDG